MCRISNNYVSVYYVLLPFLHSEELNYAVCIQYACGNVKLTLELEINEASQAAKLINNDFSQAGGCV